MYNNINDMAALNLVMSFITVKELLIAAMSGFAQGNTTKDKENTDLCYKALTAFLSKK